MTLARIAVIMPAYDVAPFVAEAIESVLTQRCDAGVRLYIAEDASNDETGRICSDYAERYPARIVYVSNPRNLGLPASFAQMHERVTEDFFCVLDGDDYFTHPDKLALQLERLDAHPEWVAVAHNAQRVTPQGEPIDLVVPADQGAQSFDVRDFVSGRVYFATASYLYRNVFKGAIPAFFHGYWGAAEVIRTMVHAEHGDVGYEPAVMSAWRVRADSRWNGLSFRTQQKKMMEAYGRWNEILGYRYDDLFAERTRELLAHHFGGWKALKALRHPLFSAQLLRLGSRNLAGHASRERARGAPTPGR